MYAHLSSSLLCYLGSFMGVVSVFTLMLVSQWTYTEVHQSLNYQIQCC